MDLSGLADFGSGISSGYMAGEQKQQALDYNKLLTQEEKQKLEDAGRQRAGQRAFARALGIVPGAQYSLPGSGPVPAVAPSPIPQPQPPMPGQPSVPMAQPGAPMPRPPMAASPASGVMAPAAAPPAPQMRPQPAPTPVQPGGAQPGGPTMPQNMQPGMSVENLAQRIKAANPGIDDQTLFQAVLTGSKVLAPQEQAALKQELMQVQLQRQLDQITAANERARSANQNRLMIAQLVQGAQNAREGQREQGQNAREGQREQGQNQRQDKAIGARQTLQDSRQAFEQAKTDYLQRFGQMKDAEKAKYRGALQKWQGAQAKLRTVINAGGDDKAIAAAQAEVDKAEGDYESLKIGDRGRAGGGAPAPNAALGGGSGGTPAPAAASPAKAPPKAGAIVNGYRFKGGDPGDQANWEKVQ